jgi:2'-hydroxyisoflavone reductase
MTILVVGGGVFVGRSMVEAALARGHRVCVFNRGRSPDPIPGVEHIVGDRNGDLSALASRTWDVVIDACGYFPRQVESLLRELRGRVGLYVFVSSVSAYAEHSRPGIREDDPLASDVDASGPDVTAANYGPMKAMCERVALELSERPPLLIRPGIIAGPRDPTGRLPYWVGRIARGGEVLVPGTPGNPLQLIDSRDLGL